jgi:hypothetical protein
MHSDKTSRRAGQFYVVVLMGLLASTTLWQEAAAQSGSLTRERQIQAGLGLLPGIGAQTGYVYPRTFYTTEAIFYLDGSPQFAGGESTIQFSLGIGGSIRPLSIVQTISNMEDTGYDLDIGLRGGPGLFFASEESRVEKNQRFSLFLEPFIRLSTEFRGRQTVYAELGFQRPLLRAGLWFGI